MKVSESVEDYDGYDEIAREYRRARQLFSVDVRGEAVYWLNQAKKKAGRDQSRGQFVSRAVAFYVRNSPYYNTKGRIAYLESREKELLENIAGLQQVIKDQNTKI
tara:strand:- start:1151 stop:1465 length:315 start_codon:yes stop_codon:yes gene_type:complete